MIKRFNVAPLPQIVSSQLTQTREIPIREIPKDQNDEHNRNKIRRVSLEKTNRFVEMQKGYGIKVEIDEETKAPKITDEVIKELEKKTKTRMADVIEVKPGVKFTEKIPFREKEKVKENSLFLTQYDIQTGFPRITKNMYKKVKEAGGGIIEKDKVEEEVSRINQSFLNEQRNRQEYTASFESRDQNFKQPMLNRFAPLAKAKPPLAQVEKKEKEIPNELAVTFAAKGQPNQVKISSYQPSQGEIVVKNEDKKKNLNKSELPARALSNPRQMERGKAYSQSITKKTWRLMSAQKREKSFISVNDRSGSFVIAHDHSVWDNSFLKNHDNSHIEEKNANNKSKMNDDSINVNYKNYLDLLDISRESS